MLKLSKSVFCLTAAKIPSGMASSVEIMADTTASFRVAGKRERTSSATEREEK